MRARQKEIRRVLKRAVRLVSVKSASLPRLALAVVVVVLVVAAAVVALLSCVFDFSSFSFAAPIAEKKRIEARLRATTMLGWAGTNKQLRSGRQASETGWWD